MAGAQFRMCDLPKPDLLCAVHMLVPPPPASLGSLGRGEHPAGEPSKHTLQAVIEMLTSANITAL